MIHLSYLNHTENSYWINKEQEKNNNVTLKIRSTKQVDCTQVEKQRLLLLHEVVNFRVDPLNDGHQVVQNVFCVVHRRIHEVPKIRVFNWSCGQVKKENVDTHTHTHNQKCTDLR